MSFKSEIENLIAKNLKTYRDNSDRFVADYNLELELTKEYNGRQLLELLQNADDAGSKEVYILWDKPGSKLVISDKGDAFSVGGIKSLMLANLSTKTKKSYIGNKGLGFRSILNWAEKISIFSNECKISFSELIAIDVFNNKLNLSESDKKKLREERDLTQQTVPFPILGIPLIEQSTSNSEWKTRIEINYRTEFESDIESQLNEIKEEILLFLNSIQNISIRKDDTETKTTLLNSRRIEKDSFTITEIENKKWKVFHKESQLPDEYQDKTKKEKQSFSLKVAFHDDLSDNYFKLFNFFPTQLSISLPCIIHGTFELNSSRNHLNESKKNEYILMELVTLLKECSLFLTTQGIDWRPYKLLTPLNKTSDSKLITAFYKELEILKISEVIYPSISQQYKALNEVMYYTDEFNSFFMQYFPESLPGLLIPLNNEIEDTFQDNKFEHNSLVESLEILSKSGISISLRAELISQLSKIIRYKDDKVRFSLLVNEAGKIILKDDIAFTPVIRSEKQFNIPKSVKVDFINSELYDALLNLHEQDFDKKEPKSRELQRIIKSVVNLQPYDSNNVIDKIITGTKDELSNLEQEETALNYIKEMVSALFVNFLNIENRQDKLKVKVPLINKLKEISDADSIFLGGSYPSGKLTEIIYEDIYSENEYLIGIEFWGFEKEEIEMVENFFLWLGVNKYSKILKIPLRENFKEKDYIQFLINHDTENYDDFHISRISKETIVSAIDNFEQIIALPINKIVLLAIKDSFIRKNLEQNDENIQWSYNYWRVLSSEYSYIRYQFIRSNIFTKYILEDGSEDLNKLINKDFQIDYEFLGTFGINKTEVKSILIKLGAKESFNEIESGNIYEILKSIPERDTSKKGKLTQTIYKLALDSLIKQNSTIPVPQNISFFARKNDNEDYKPKEEIFYSDNATLPKKILDTLYILNLPKRTGEDNVEKYFGVRSLKEFKIQINSENIKKNKYNLEFAKQFELIKPYLLAYRLDSPNLKRRVNDSDFKRKEAKAIKQCRVHLVDECYFDFAEKNNISIEQKEYINIKDDFYYKDNCITSIDALKRDSVFCDAFAEMMCIIFKVNELKNEFRQILKNDLSDTIHLATQDLGKDSIEEAYKLLGLSRVEIDFWKRVFDLKGKKLSEPIENTEVLKTKVYEDLGLTLPDNYSNIDFETYANNESFGLLKKISEELSLKLEQLIPQGILPYHQKKFANAIKDNEYKFKELLWLKLSNEKQEQSRFISILNKYNLDFPSAIENKMIPFKFDFEVDYTLKLGQWIKEYFEIDLFNKNSEAISIEIKYNDLLLKNSIEDSDIEDESIRSLLYFDDNMDEIENFIKEYLKTEHDGESSNKNENNDIGNIIDASLSKSGKAPTFKNNSGSSSTWIHNKQSDRVKKRNGKAAELLVYNTFKKEYGVKNVKWVSGNSTTPDKNDKLHYDITYKNDENEEWNYVEVKSISENYFIISKPEKEMGMSEPDNYEMALVKDKDIMRIKNIFKFENGDNFDNNQKFIAEAKDYVFYFDINEQNEN